MNGPAVSVTDSSASTRARIVLVVATAATIAAIPVAPIIFLIPAVLGGALLIARGRPPGPEAALIVLLAVVGSVAQVAGFVLVRDAPPAHVPGLPATGDAPFDGQSNLIANSDLSWLRGWSRAGGASAYATPIEPGFWRLTADDPISGARHSEIRTLSEIPIGAQTSYTLSVLLRHDGSSFEGELAFRTRESFDLPGTEFEAVGTGLLRATATLPPRPSATRLRTLHLVGLGGDWTAVDVGFAQLVPGEIALPYRPRSDLMHWSTGVLWWLALATGLITSAVAIRSARDAVGRHPIALGLLAGIGVQAALVVSGWLGAEGVGVRFGGSLLEPNVAAHVVIVAALAVAAISPRPLRDGGIALLFAAVTIWFSGSRAGLVGLGIGSVALAAVLPMRRRGRWLIGVAAALVVGIGAVLAGASGSRLTASLIDDPNVHARLQAIETSFALAAAYPITGIGHDNFRRYYEFAVPSRPGPRYRNEHGHSLLDLATAFGWPVAATFALLLTLMVRNLLRAGAVRVALTVGVALLLNLFDLTLFNAALFLSAWAAYCVATSDRTERRPYEPTGGTRGA